jgi:hypothetical protein
MIYAWHRLAEDGANVSAGWRSICATLFFCYNHRGCCLKKSSIKSCREAGMLIDRNEFAYVCAVCTEVFGVDAHYLIAVAYRISGIFDGVVRGCFGPFRFTKREWSELRPPNFHRIKHEMERQGWGSFEITNWRAQCVVAALLTQRDSRKLLRRLHRPPTLFELAEETWDITPGHLRTALKATSGLVTKPQSESQIEGYSVELSPEPPRPELNRVLVGSQPIQVLLPKAERVGPAQPSSWNFSIRRTSALFRELPGFAYRDIAGGMKGIFGGAAGPTAIVKGIGVNLPLVAALGNMSTWAVRGVGAALGRWRRRGKAEDRRVDLALLKMDQRSTAVTEDEALLPLAHYQVRVHIGERSPESLLPEPPPPILPLLPHSPSGHDLEVAIFGKDFAIDGETIQPLFLPANGASEPVYFQIIAPEQPGPAQFRIGIYHQNHLIQSFVFSGVIGSSEPASRARARFLLEFSRTANFKNLTALAPRRLSIGLNANGAATHGLFIKSVGVTVEFPLPQRLLDDQVCKFRKLLQMATFSGDNQARFSTYPKDGDPISPDFNRFVAQFAEYGHELHRALLQRQELLPSLRALAQSERQTIQIVRFDPNFVLPWAAIYDFNLPTLIAGAPVPEVCRGLRQATDGSVVPCGHKREDAVYCINGFWGVRHIVEELIGAGSGVDAAHEIIRARTQGAVRLAVDTPEPHTEEMRRTFEKEMGESFAPITAHDALLDLLWKDAERPALLIVLGHLEIKPIAGDPVGPRIALPKDRDWLLPGEILDRVLEKTWDQPRTVVLLMGCQTALMDLGTLTGFLTAFNSACAAGVAGTEVVAFSRLLTRFAQEIALALWRKETLGAAITDFRRRLLVAGNPLAFVFQALGGADIHLSLGK